MFEDPPAKQERLKIPGEVRTGSCTSFRPGVGPYRPSNYECELVVEPLQSRPRFEWKNCHKSYVPRNDRAGVAPIAESGLPQLTAQTGNLQSVGDKPAAAPTR